MTPNATEIKGEFEVFQHQLAASACFIDVDKTLQANLKTRFAKSPSHVSIYKKRLLEAGVIDEPVRGKLVFALPGFKDYLIKTMG